jgi:hypothetical protein
MSRDDRLDALVYMITGDAKTPPEPVVYTPGGGGWFTDGFSRTSEEELKAAALRAKNDLIKVTAAMREARAEALKKLLRGSSVRWVPMNGMLDDGKKRRDKPRSPPAQWKSHGAGDELQQRADKRKAKKPHPMLMQLTARNEIVQLLDHNDDGGTW